MKNFMNISPGSKSSNVSVNKSSSDPGCFGILWDPDDYTCTDRCILFDDCEAETKRLNKEKAAKANAVSGRHYPKSTRTSSTSTSYSHTSSSTNLVRPKDPEGFPMGTGYFPKEREGDVGAFERAFVVAWKEGKAVAASSFFEGLGEAAKMFFGNLGKFARNIPEWDEASGRRVYGDNYGPEPKKKTIKKTPSPLPPKTPRRE